MHYEAICAISHYPVWDRQKPWIAFQHVNAAVCTKHAVDDNLHYNMQSSDMQWHSLLEVARHEYTPHRMVSYVIVETTLRPFIYFILELRNKQIPVRKHTRANKKKSTSGI